MITVKLVKLGSQIKDYCLEYSASVSDLLEIADETFVQGSVTRNNQVVNRDTPLRDGDRIYLGRATKGNIDDPFEVSFMKLGGSVVNLPAEDGYTIKQVLQQLDDAERRNFYRADGSVAYEFRVSGNTRPVDENYVLQRPTNGDSLRVICAQRVKGNK